MCTAFMNVCVPLCMYMHMYVYIGACVCYVYAVEDDLEFLILLPLPPEYEDYRLPHPVYVVLGLISGTCIYLASTRAMQLPPQPAMDKFYQNTEARERREGCG